MFLRSALRKQIENLSADRSGATAPLMAICILAILSLVFATIALASDSRAANNLQLSADSAALAGATAFINATSPKADDRVQEARVMAEATARENADYYLTTMNTASVVEDAYGQHTRVTVQMAFEPANPAAKVAGRNSVVKIKRSAEAEATWGFPLCILGLNASGTGFSMSDSVDLTAENCVIWTNSKASTSMALSGGSGTTKFFCSGGGASRGARLSPAPHEQCDAIPDPLADWVPPAPGRVESTPGEVYMPPQSVIESFLETLLLAGTRAGLLPGGSNPNELLEDGGAGDLLSAVQSISAGGPINGGGRLNNPNGFPVPGTRRFIDVETLVQLIGQSDNVDPALYAGDRYYDTPTLTLSPGTYNGLDIHEGHVEFTPGVYHIVDAPLFVRRRATLTGEGVTIILHGPDATFNVLDEARLTLTAPEGGTTAGFALTEDRYASLAGATMPSRSRITGSGRIEAIGTIYLPRQQFSITGDGAGDQTSPLLQIVADTVDMADSGQLNIVFDTSETDIPVTIKPERTARLVN